MIYLDSNTKLDIVLTAAKTTNDMDCSVNFFDIGFTRTEETTLTKGFMKRTASNGTTDATICAAPEVGRIRNVKTMFIHNRDTAAKTVVIKTDNGTTEFIVAKRSLNADQTMVYEDGFGWSVI